MLGWHPENMTGRLFYNVVTIEDEKGNVIPREKRPVYLALAIRTTTTTTTGPTYVYARKDKTKFPVAIKVSPVVIDNKIIGAVEVFRDITKERQVDKAKSEFISLASHQLKTPPTVIKLLTERILGGEIGRLTKKQKEYINDIRFSNQRMIDIVNMLLDASHIELGTFKIELKEKDICLVVKNILHDFEPIFNKKQLAINQLYPKNSKLVLLDESLFRMIINNLLVNAISYTPQGGSITVECRQITGGQVLGQVFLGKDSFAIIITDTGYGIPKADYHRLFTKFFRADNVRQKQTDGTGLGLYIIKSIIDNIGGLLWFCSQENKGTTFYVVIPMTGMRAKAGNKDLIG